MGNQGTIIGVCVLWGGMGGLTPNISPSPAPLCGSRAMLGADSSFRAECFLV